MGKIALVLTAVLFLSLAACDTGKACKESCEKDDECGLDYSCLASDQGRMCLPRECAGCFSSADKPYCYKSEETVGEGSGASLTCKFERCDTL